MIGGVASGTVVSFDLPLRHFHKTARTGTLVAGCFLLSDVKIFNRKAIGTKFKKNVLVTLDGKSHETLSQALGLEAAAQSANPGMLYVFSSVLSLASEPDE